jgi:hypothetical protein
MMRMATFRLRSQPSPRLLKLKWKLPVFCAASLAVLVASIYLSFHLQHDSRLGWLSREVLYWVASVALVATFTGGLVYIRLPAMVRRSNEQEYEITEAGIARHYPDLPDLFVPASQIVNFTPRRNSLLLRLQNRPRAMLLPSELVGFEEIPELLERMGVPKLPWGRFALLPPLLKFLALVAVCGFSASILFRSKDPLEVGIAGLCYLAIMGVLTFRNSSPYQGPGARSQRWIQPLTMVLWSLTVGLRLWTVMHPHPLHHGHPPTRTLRESQAQRKPAPPSQQP